MLMDYDHVDAQCGTLQKHSGLACHGILREVSSSTVKKRRLSIQFLENLWSATAYHKSFILGFSFMFRP